jgi:arylsulfatase
MNRNRSLNAPAIATVLVAIAPSLAFAEAKPNILLIVADDHGYGDIGVYGGGEGRGMPTPNLDKMADEGMTFFSFYGQPSCRPEARPCRPGASPTVAA